jgi:NitT/TauT family transport system ATP-binding protein
MIDVRDVSHSFVTRSGRERVTTRVFEGLSLRIPDVQFVSVVGASGCGKTTLLRMIAGLVEPDRGDVRVAGEHVRGPDPSRPIVFQDSALYPWRTVEANVRLGLELSGLATGSEARRLVDEHLELVHLSEFRNHYPSQLSVGMRQRAGLARALAVQPRILLLDEPFAALDAISRHRLGGELLRIWESERRTVVLVTHSLDEALTLSDRVVLVRDGRVVSDTEVGLDRPRDVDAVIEDPHFRELRSSLWNLL